MNKEKPTSFRQQFKARQQKRAKKGFSKIMTCLLLIGIFFLVLFMSAYFNYESGFATNSDGTTLGTRFYLSGPDPYYNMRLLEQTVETGTYPFTQPHNGNADPLLNYPVGERGARPPLFVLAAAGSTFVLQNFMSQIDAMGWSMLVLPCIYGALMVFPLYLIGKELFNRKVGLIAAILLPFIPIFIGGGHGAAFSLFDHDSFIQLLFILVFYFVIKMIKEPDIKRSSAYGALAGLFTGAVYLAWVAAQEIHLVLFVSLIVIFLFSLLKTKENHMKTFYAFLTLSLVAYLVGLPWAIISSDLIGFPLFMMTFLLFIIVFSYLSKKMNIPWIISIPTLSGLSFSLLGILFLVNIGLIDLGGRINQLSVFFFGEGIYGSKISLTIAEAHTFNMSGTVMSIGPFVYWVGLAGFALYFVKTYREKFKMESLFFISLFLVLLWLVTTAGRFLNDIIPYLLIFAGWLILTMIDKLNYKKVREAIRYLGLFRGLKHGMNALRVLGVVFIIVIFLTNGFLAMDAAVPQIDKEKYFGKDYQGYFGQSLGQSYYWSDACYWLSQQDTDIKNDGDKPAVISWWDYGFYLSSMSKHPTVADNYQDGIPPASNFHTAATEQEAVCVLAIRCLEGYTFKNNYDLPVELETIIFEYLKPVYNGTQIIASPGYDFINYFEDPEQYAPSYNTLIDPEYGNKELRVNKDNARYQDCYDLMKNLTDEEITNFYIDIKEVTGFDIRYYAVEAYDTRIFDVFSFLSDKSTFGFTSFEDRYRLISYVDPETEIEYTPDQAGQLDYEIQTRLTSKTNLKDAYYNTMFYRVYYGFDTENRIPTYLMKHFSLKYVSPYVVIAKYSEGAKINGTVTCGNKFYTGCTVVVLDQYSVPHDNTIVDSNGTYSLLAPSGNCTLVIFVGNDYINITQPITVSEKQAERKQAYQNSEDISVNESSVNITVITDKIGLSLSCHGVSCGQYVYSEVIPNEIIRFTSLYPDLYDLSVVSENGTVLYEDKKFFETGENQILLNL